MKKKDYKGRCRKRCLSKCEGVCKTYDDISFSYAERLEASGDVKSFRCNVPLDGLELGEYTTDFVCVMTDGELMVRECVERKLLTRPLTVKLLDASRTYWMRRGVKDWGLVIDGE